MSFDPILTLFDGTDITEDTLGEWVRAWQFPSADISVVVDQDEGNTNSVQITLEHSNDMTNVVAGAEIKADGAVDVNTLVNHPLLGRYTRVNINVTNANAIPSIKVIAVGKEFRA